MTQQQTLSAGQARRNFMLGILNGTLFRLFFVLADPGVVMPWFIQQLTTSTVAVGLLLPLNRGSGLLPQLLLCDVFQRQRRKMPAYRVLVAIRVVTWALLVAAILILGNRNPGLLLLLVMALFAIHWAATATGGMLFNDIAAKAIPAERRGSFFGTREFAGGLLGLLGAGSLARSLLDPARGFTFPTNFGIIFGLAGIALAAGEFFLLLLVEPDVDPGPVAPGQSRGLIPFDRLFGVLCRDSNLRLVVGERLALTVTAAAMPFYSVYAKQVLGAPVAVAGTYLTVYTAATVLSVLAWGWVRDRFGCQKVVLWTALLSLPLPLIPLLAGGRIDPVSFTGVFLLLGLAQGGVQIEQWNLVVDVAPPAERVLYLGVTNIVVGVFSLALISAGWIAARFGIQSLFVASAAAAAVGALLAIPMRTRTVH